MQSVRLSVRTHIRPTIQCKKSNPFNNSLSKWCTKKPCGGNSSSSLHGVAASIVCAEWMSTKIVVTATQKKCIQII